LLVGVALATESSLREDDTKVNPGHVIVDPEIQVIAENILEDALKQENAKAGFAIVAEPSSGRILAIANIDKTGKLKGYWSLSQRLEPASVIKSVVIGHAIDKGLTSPEESHNCENGAYKYGKHVYHDWKVTGWEQLSTTDTLVNSSNICAIKIGEKVGAAGIKQMIADFGFGPGGTASEFPMAKPGLLPPPENPQDPKLIPYISAGFGLRITPLELVQAYGAIANGGSLMKPQLANKSGGQKIRQVLETKNADKIKEILRQVVLRGTGKPARSERWVMAGKTATSYIPDLTEWDLVKRQKNANFAGFIGFAPAKNPKVEVYVGIYDPNTDRTGAHGGAHAAPVFKRITEEVLAHMKVPEDKTGV